MSYAVVRIRGSIDMNEGMKSTMKMLNLNTVNSCVIVPDNPSIKGMLKKAQSWITWGEVSKETEAALKKKGEKIFRLSPPSKGYKNIRAHYPNGAYGYRGDNINDLIKRML